MPRNHGLSCLVLSIEDTVEELKELEEFFQMYYDSLQKLHSQYLFDSGIRLNLRRMHLLVDSHEMFTEKLVKELEGKLKKVRKVLNQIESQGSENLQ